MTMKALICLLPLLLGLVQCSQDLADVKIIHPYPKVDFHQHFKPSIDIDQYLATMKKFNVKKSVVLALKSLSNTYQDQNQLVMAMYHKYPEQIIPFITFVENDRDGLKIVKKFHKQGARGLKFIGWLGKQVERNHYNLTSKSLFEVYDYCQSHHLITLFHIDFRKHQENFHSKLSMIQKAYPQLKIVLAHGGIDLAYLKDFEVHLKNPNLYIDLSFYGTFKEYWFQQVSRYHSSLRRLILKFPDQFLFATDLFPAEDKSNRYMSEVMQGSIDLLEKRRYFRPEFNKLNRGYGLSLPKSVLDKIYYLNAQTLLGH